MGCSSTKAVISGIPPKHLSSKHEQSLAMTTTSLQKMRFLESCFVIWFRDEISNKFENEIKHLQKLVYGLKIFNNIDACVTFINNIQDEKVFLIISGTYRTLECFQNLSQLEKLFIFDPFQQQNDVNYRTLKYDIIRNIDNLHKKLEEDVQLCEVDLIPISVVSPSSQDILFSSVLTKQQASFIFGQMINEIASRLKFESSSKDVLVDFCRLHYVNIDKQLRLIDEFSKDYRPNKILWWLVQPCFVSKILNRVQRTREIDILYKFGFILKQANLQLNRLYKENVSLIETISIVYRGKTMTCVDFNTTIKNKCGSFLSFTNFLIATRNKKVAIDFVDRRLAIHPDMTGIVFEIHIDHTLLNEKNPFALLKDADMNKDEICFYSSTVFRIESVEETMNGATILWFVKLKQIDNNDQELLHILAPIRNPEVHNNQAYFLGKLLIDMEEYRRAEQVLLALFQDPNFCSQPRRLVRLHNGLADIYTCKNEYTKALDHYHQALQMSLTYLPPDHPNLAPIYKAIGNTHLNQNDCIHALENYEKAMGLLEKDTLEFTVDLVTDLQTGIDKAKKLLESNQ
ncbi:unnamed protein product [Rotaria sp. Silwood2]|nr:unnamed protein product [Rotaria sp. Silwood2]CAF2812966.1 unnamed protein product [Rotaria sp. Silwood2]CAF4260600.1 unnamed protein product [Rotaria sp. Silwood2]CAF4353344.1 unnamed protein product [Rotaria sp. Silwood2]